jgi:hypothetical protein
MRFRKFFVKSGVKLDHRVERIVRVHTVRLATLYLTKKIEPLSKSAQGRIEGL